MAGAVVGGVMVIVLSAAEAGGVVEVGVEDLPVEVAGVSVVGITPGILAAAAAAAASVFSLASTLAFSLRFLTVSSTLDDAWPYTSADRWICRCPIVAHRVLLASWNKRNRFELGVGNNGRTRSRWLLVLLFVVNVDGNWAAMRLR